MLYWLLDFPYAASPQHDQRAGMHEHEGESVNAELRGGKGHALVGQARDSLTSSAESEVRSSDLPPPCSSFPFPPHRRQTGSASAETGRDSLSAKTAGCLLNVSFKAVPLGELPATMTSYYRDWISRLAFQAPH